MTNKKDLSERDICTMFITPALERAGWDMKKQVREEVGFTDGRIYVKGNLTTRGKRKRADYILYYKPNIPVAVIEAKDNKHSVMAGIQQGLDYATILDIPSVFSSNGDSFYEHDRTASSGKVESEFPLHQFPSPEELWQRYKRYKGIENPEAERISAQDYFFDGTGRSPVTISKSRLTAPWRLLLKGSSAFYLPWPPAPVKHTLRFKSSTACGKPVPKNAFFFWQTVMP
jgi:type I restriction enzyme R subunit